MEITYSSNFIRRYKKLPIQIKDIIEKQEELFRHNPFDERLKTHKLKGKFNGFFSFSVGFKYRVMFKLIENKKIAYFLSVGDHEVYQ